MEAVTKDGTVSSHLKDLEILIYMIPIGQYSTRFKDFFFLGGGGSEKIFR